MRWETIEEFESYHHDIIRATCELVAPKNVFRDYFGKEISTEIIVGDMACDLWNRVRKFASRSYVNLCFDCCYAILKLCGHRVSIIEMEAAALEVAGRPVVVWQSNRSQWWKDDRAKDAIITVCMLDGMHVHGQDREALYQGLTKWWSDEEE